ncbi:hypothetical protein ACFL2V_07080 [Pseudomonadota bacterium]
MIFVLNELYKRLVKLLRVVGVVNSVILLTLFYYLILGPIAVVRKMFSKVNDGEEIKSSYWVKSNIKTNITKQY